LRSLRINFSKNSHSISRISRILAICWVCSRGFKYRQYEYGKCHNGLWAFCFYRLLF